MKERGPAKFVEGMRNRLRLFNVTLPWSAASFGADLTSKEQQRERLQTIPGTRANFDLPVANPKPWIRKKD